MIPVAWFVDGTYAYKCFAAASGGRNIAYKQFREMVEADVPGNEIVDAQYFNTEVDDGQRKFHHAISRPHPKGAGLTINYGSMRTKKYDWPDQMGGGPVVHPKTGLQLELPYQKEVDVILAFTLAQSYNRRAWKKLYLVAGDADFLAPVRYFKEQLEIEVIMFGIRNSGGGHPSISAEYKNVARQVFFDDYVNDLAAA